MEERRASRRINIEPGDFVWATVRTVTGKEWAAEVLEISSISVKIRLQSQDDAPLRPGMQVDLHVDFGGKGLDVIGVVRRRWGRKYGLFFPQVLEGASEIQSRIAQHLDTLRPQVER